MDGTNRLNKNGAPFDNKGIDLHHPGPETELPEYRPEDDTYYDPIIEKSYHSLTASTAEEFLIHLANSGQFVASARLAKSGDGSHQSRAQA